MSCIGCTKRHVGCHSTCEEYIAESKQRLELKKKINKERKKDTEANAVMIERKLKRKERRK